MEINKNKISMISRLDEFEKNHITINKNMKRMRVGHHRVVIMEYVVSLVLTDTHVNAI